MHKDIKAPQPRKILSDCQAIRSLWSSDKRRARRHLAETRQRELFRWLVGGHDGCRRAY